MLKLFFERELGRKNITKIEESMEDYLAHMPFTNQINISCPGTRCTYNLCTSKDGKYLASLHGNHNVVIMEVIGMKYLTTLIGHTRSPWSAAFHPLYSNILVTGCIAGHVIIWKIKNVNHDQSQIIGRFIVGDNYAVSAITFHSSGKYFIFSSMNYVYYWNLQDATPTKRNRYSHKIKYLKLASNDTCLLVGFKLPELEIYLENNRFSRELNMIEVSFKGLIKSLKCNRKIAIAPNWHFSEYVDVRAMIKKEMSVESIASTMTAYFSNQRTILALLISKYYNDLFTINLDETLDANPFTLEICDLLNLFLSSHPYEVADFELDGFLYFIDQTRTLYEFMRPTCCEKYQCEPFVENYLNVLFSQDIVELLMPMIAYISRFPFTDRVEGNAIVEKLLDEYRTRNRSRSTIDLLIMLCFLQYVITKILGVIECNIRTYTKSLAEHYLKSCARDSQMVSRVEFFQIAALKYNTETFFGSNQVIEFNSDDAVVPLCFLNSSTSVCVSDRPQSKQKFVAAILLNHSVGVYSLDWPTLGHWLYKFNVEMTPITLALSPSNRYLMIAGRSCYPNMSNTIHTFPIDHFYFRFIREFSSDYKVNAISFLRSFAEGLVVGVDNEGILYLTFTS